MYGGGEFSNVSDVLWLLSDTIVVWLLQSLLSLPISRQPDEVASSRTCLDKILNLTLGDWKGAYT